MRGIEQPLPHAGGTSTGRYRSMFLRPKDHPTTASNADHAPDGTQPLLDIEVTGVVEAIGQHHRFGVEWPQSLGFSISTLLRAIDGALVTRFVIKLRGDERVHSLPAGQWIEKLALTREGHKIAFVIGGADRKILSFENLSLWPGQNDRSESGAQPALG